MGREYLENVPEAIKVLVRKRGYPFLMNSHYCKEWVGKHDSCERCESEVGCHKGTQLLALSAMAMMPYTPRFIRERIEEEMREVLGGEEEGCRGEEEKECKEERGEEKEGWSFDGRV